MTEKDTTYDARNRPLTITTAMAGVGADRTTTNTYNKYGTLATLTDAKGAMTSYGYDALGRLSASTPPPVSHEDVGGTAAVSSAVTTTGYDTFGNPTQVRNARAYSIVSTFDKLNRRTRVDQPTCTTACVSSSAYEQWVFDAIGNIAQYRDRRSSVTDYAFDTLNRAVQTTLPAVDALPRATRVTHYDMNGNVVDQTNEIGAVSTVTYNQMDLPKTVNTQDRYPSAVTATTTIDYNDLGQATWTEDPNNKTSTAEFLLTGEQTKRIDQTGASWQTEYDGQGRPTRAVDPLGRSTSYTYNPANQVMSAIRRDAAATAITTSSSAYDNNGNKTTDTSARGYATTYSYDAANRLTQVQVPTGATPITTTYGYDRTNNLTRVTDGRGNVTTYTYNQWNLSGSTIEPSTTAHPALVDRTFSTTYDAGGLPTAEAEPGRAITRVFNTLGQLTTETGSGAGLTSQSRIYGVDMAGRITSVNTPSSTQSFVLNDRNQVISASGDYGASGFGYDIKGRMTSRTDDSTVGLPQQYAFTWTDRDELLTSTDPTTATATYSRNTAAELTTVTQGATTRALAYDSIGRLSTDLLKNTSTSAVLHQSSYTYDPDDDVLTKNVTAPGNTAAGNNTYTYDQPGRLASWTNPASALTTYAYDAAGNRTEAGAATYTYDQRNRLLTGPSETYTWTARGTLASQTISGTTTAYAFDGLNRMASATRSATVVAYTYDGLDRMRSRCDPTCTNFKYAGLESDPYYQITGSNWVNFRHSPAGRTLSVQAQSSGSQAWTVGTDLHGDATHFYNATTATVGNTKLLDPWGKPTGTTGSGEHAANIGYQGDWTDTFTGDVNMGARWYNPSVGSFRNRDTVFGTLNNPVRLNRYAYAGNNPTTYWDPTGRDFDWGGYQLDPGQFAGIVDSLPVEQQQGIAMAAVATVPVSYETANPSAGVYNYIINYGNGSSTISTTAPTGIAVSDPTTTERSGNLSYTPDNATAAAAVVLINDGFGAGAIGQAINDAAKAGSTPSITAILDAADNPGAPPNVVVIPNVLALNSCLDDAGVPNNPQGGCKPPPSGGGPTAHTDAPPPVTKSPATASGARVPSISITPGAAFYADNKTARAQGAFADPANFQDSLGSRKECWFGYCTDRSTVTRTWNGSLITGTDTMISGVLMVEQKQTLVYAAFPGKGLCDIDDCMGKGSPIPQIATIDRSVSEKFRIDLTGLPITLPKAPAVTGTSVSPSPLFVNSSRHVLQTGQWINDPLAVYDFRRIVRS